MGTTDNVLLFLHPNDGHSESIERIICYIKVRFFQYLPICSVYASLIAVLEQHSRRCSMLNCSQRSLQDQLHDRAASCGGEFLVHATFVQALYTIRSVLLLLETNDDI
jgi:hypothetical protein